MTGRNAARHRVTNLTLKKDSIQPMELYNLKEDIGESTDLVEDNPEKVEEMAKVLTDYLKDVDEQMPIDQATGKKVG